MEFQVVYHRRTEDDVKVCLAIIVLGRSTLVFTQCCYCFLMTIFVIEVPYTITTGQYSCGIITDLNYFLELPEQADLLKFSSSF